MEQMMGLAELYAAKNLARLPLLTDVYSSLEATLPCWHVDCCLLCCETQEPMSSFPFAGALTLFPFAGHSHSHVLLLGLCR